MPLTDRSFELLEANTRPLLQTVRTLLREYADWLKADFCFQGFEAELASLPGTNASARGGAPLLAMRADEAAGCVALKLYAKLGFHKVPAYCDNSLADAIYMERALQR